MKSECEIESESESEDSSPRARFVLEAGARATRELARLALEWRLASERKQEKEAPARIAEAACFQRRRQTARRRRRRRSCR